MSQLGPALQTEGRARPRGSQSSALWEVYCVTVWHYNGKLQECLTDICVYVWSRNSTFNCITTQMALIERMQRKMKSGSWEVTIKRPERLKSWSIFPKRKVLETMAPRRRMQKLNKKEHDSVIHCSETWLHSFFLRHWHWFVVLLTRLQ